MAIENGDAIAQLGIDGVEGTIKIKDGKIILDATEEERRPHSISFTWWLSLTTKSDWDALHSIDDVVKAMKRLGVKFLPEEKSMRTVREALE